MDAKITKNYPFSLYEVVTPPLSEKDRALFFDFADLLKRKTSPETFCGTYNISPEKVKNFLGKFLQPISFDENRRKELKQSIGSLLAPIADAPEILTDIIFSEFYGYKKIEPLFHDDKLEEIMINGINKPVFVYHREYGMCKTNLSFESHRELEELASQLSSSSDEKNLIDARLPDGSRVNIVFPPISREPTITVRKFKKKRFNIIDLIQNKTITSELAAFLWVAVEGLRFYPLNILIAGGTSCGKTTFLNALCAFIPPNERIVTIEDTRELEITNVNNIVPLETSSQNDLDSLLKNSLRMRPDRIMVGEVRGKEAETLFTAMNVGHRGTMGTLHANSARDAVSRLQNTPMKVPLELIPRLDLVIIEQRIFDRAKGMQRKVIEVSEVSRIEKTIALNNIFVWNPENDALEKTKLPSENIEKISKNSGFAIPDIFEEINKRKKVLDYLVKNNINDSRVIEQTVIEYYKKQLVR